MRLRPPGKSRRDSCIPQTKQYLRNKRIRWSVSKEKQGKGEDQRDFRRNSQCPCTLCSPKLTKIFTDLPIYLDKLYKWDLSASFWRRECYQVHKNHAWSKDVELANFWLFIRLCGFKWALGMHWPNKRIPDIVPKIKRAYIATSAHTSKSDCYNAKVRSKLPSSLLLFQHGIWPAI